MLIAVSVVVCVIDVTAVLIIAAVAGVTNTCDDNHTCNSESTRHLKYLSLRHREAHKETRGRLPMEKA